VTGTPPPQWNPTVWPPQPAPLTKEQIDGDPGALSILEGLRDVTRDLQAYIDDRARELAQPLIQEAQERADGLVADVERESVRRRDLIEEVRRQMGAMEKQLARKEAAVLALARSVLRLAEHIPAEVRDGHLVVRDDIQQARRHLPWNDPATSPPRSQS
jgi:vacuolar-type H+-ATPase subunit H